MESSLEQANSSVTQIKESLELKWYPSQDKSLKQEDSAGSRKRGRRLVSRMSMARRGKAADIHMAQRMRREKMSKKMRLLEDAVPGCYKGKSKAAMLEEAIKCVQSLHNQVGFLSMRLAAATTASGNSFEPLQEHYAYLEELVRES
ncbi:transcription factor bHLH75-like [Canna indica]|uniref:Transcription factor bHLH75-like n=1 Tax=Canna indica TaxID=4628 RepID=A0AAQ3KLT4_9LILI|nr:transcription factor bHLH75-like [Canna indica]